MLQNRIRRKREQNTGSESDAEASPPASLPPCVGCTVEVPQHLLMPLRRGDGQRCHAVVRGLVWVSPLGTEELDNIHMAILRRNVQRRHAIVFGLVLDLRRPILAEELDHLQVPVLCCNVERGGTVALGPVHVSPGSVQVLHHRRVPVVRGRVGGRDSVLIGPVLVGTLLMKVLDDLCVPALRGYADGRCASVGRCVQSCAGLAEVLDNWEVAALRRYVDGRHAVQLGLVLVRALLAEISYDFCMTILGCDVQRGGPILLLGLVLVCASLAEPHDCVQLALASRSEERSLVYGWRNRRCHLAVGRGGHAHGGDACKRRVLARRPGTVHRYVGLVPPVLCFTSGQSRQLPSVPCTGHNRTRRLRFRRFLNVLWRLLPDLHLHDQPPRRAWDLAELTQALCKHLHRGGLWQFENSHLLTRGGPQ
mmetsp:Transcript_79495/g.184477  ORF Transcript_79495/g.184477 Transcript_79495/m.184477 type:complete len:422 (-) Transcript_79495:156-1421(-)